MPKTIAAPVNSTPKSGKIILTMAKGPTFGAPLVMAIAMMLLFLALHLKAMRNEVLRRRVKALRAYEVQVSAGLASQPAE